MSEAHYKIAVLDKESKLHTTVINKSTLIFFFNLKLITVINY